MDDVLRCDDLSRCIAYSSHCTTGHRYVLIMILSYTFVYFCDRCSAVPQKYVGKNSIRGSLDEEPVSSLISRQSGRGVYEE